MLVIPALLLTACGGGSSSTVTLPTTYLLTIASANPSTGVAIAATPGDIHGTASGTTGFILTYNAGVSVTLTAPAKSGSNAWSGWTGCASTTATTCTVTMNANQSVVAKYAGPTVTSVTVTPGPATSATIGATQQFTATVAGTGSFDSTVTWSLLGPPGSALSSGTLSATGLYTTPYPAPATVTVVATSTQDTTKSGSSTVTLSAPATASGPALSVDVGSPTHPISPYIYGMNAYTLAPSVMRATNLPLDRWGGDSTSSYNYLTDTTNAAADFWFENSPGSATNYPTGSQFNSQVILDASNGTKTLGTVPLTGYSPLRNSNCSFSVKKYGDQKATAPNNTDCGNGVLINGTKVVNDPKDTYTAVDQTFTAAWVKFLVKEFGTAAKGGVAIYDLDNEPEWWDGVHIDIHPAPFTYDELTNDGLTYAKAIKDNDATAEVSGPVVSSWMAFFYSKKDIETGWGSGPCYCANGNPVDRLAHGDVPFLEYYLQQFKKYDDTNHVRLLDYLDLHTYFAANNLAFSTAGDTGTQEARLNSTRVLWDPTYTDPGYTDPNDRTSTAKPFPPKLIPLMHSWIAKDYPGTKTAITEYNWGGLEHINGAIAQADILGIFGREGLDLGTLWGPPDPVKQVPGEVAYEIFRNYDGANSSFGDTALTSTSGDQGKLSVYGALRTADNMVTVVILNKTYGDLTTNLSLPNLIAGGKAKVFLYSNANLAGIAAEPDAAVTAPSAPGGASSFTSTFPAQSITLLIIPKM